ncbi:MAG: DUF1564 family protein [Leptospira sp.]|nr:DUF1564 family protein [Leptospira sp.]
MDRISTFYYQGVIHQNGTLYLPRNAKNESTLDYDELRNTSILVPESIYRRFFSTKKSVNAVIKHLLEEGSTTLIFGMKPPVRNSIAKEYQKSGQSLKKISCRIEESLLIELEMMAQYFRISRCRLIGILFELKSIGWLRLMRVRGIVRATTNPREISFKISFFLRKNPKRTFSTELKEIPKDS